MYLLLIHAITSLNISHLQFSEDNEVASEDGKSHRLRGNIRSIGGESEKNDPVFLLEHEIRL